MYAEHQDALTRLRATILVVLDIQSDGTWYAIAPWLSDGVIRATWEEALEYCVSRRPAT